MHSLEVTLADVALALARWGINGYRDPDNPVDGWYDELNLDEASKAADLTVADFDGKADALVSNLEVQMRALGVPHTSLTALLAARQAEKLSQDLPPVPAGGLARPRM